MAWQLNATELFYIAIIAFGVIGFTRGWRREVVSLAFVLTGVLFLYLNGGEYIAKILFQYLPRIIGFVLTEKAPAKPPDPSKTVVEITTLITFIVIVFMGFAVGNRAFEGPKTSADRILGIIPAVITGFAIISSSIFVGNTLFTLAIEPIKLNSVGNYMLVIFIIAVVALVLGLISASAKKSGGAAKK
jgi:peptidoglycan/LPS O-acetylase OafA/YrhL